MGKYKFNTGYATIFSPGKPARLYLPQPIYSRPQTLVGFFPVPSLPSTADWSDLLSQTLSERVAMRVLELVKSWHSATEMMRKNSTRYHSPSCLLVQYTMSGSFPPASSLSRDLLPGRSLSSRDLLPGASLSSPDLLRDASVSVPSLLQSRYNSNPCNIRVHHHRSHICFLDYSNVHPSSTVHQWDNKFQPHSSPSRWDIRPRHNKGSQAPNSIQNHNSDRHRGSIYQSLELGAAVRQEARNGAKDTLEQ